LGVKLIDCELKAMPAGVEFQGGQSRPGMAEFRVRQELVIVETEIYATVAVKGQTIFARSVHFNRSAPLLSDWLPALGRTLRSLCATPGIPRKHSWEW
jgi:hypothetical protein